MVEIDAIKGAAKKVGDFYKRNARRLAILAVILFLAFVVFKIVRALKRPPNANYVPGAPVPIGWDPTALTEEIFHVIDGVAESANSIDSAYSKFNQLNDNQMIDVYNTWLDKKYDKEKKYYIWPYGTLTHAIDNGPGFIAIGVPNNKTIALANLHRLQLE